MRGGGVDIVTGRLLCREEKRPEGVAADEHGGTRLAQTQLGRLERGANGGSDGPRRIGPGRRGAGEQARTPAEAADAQEAACTEAVPVSAFSKAVPFGDPRPVQGSHNLRAW